MNPTTAINWLIAIPIAVLIGALSLALDGMPDHSAEHAAAQSLDDAHQAAQREMRRKAAAYAICYADHGPNVQATWVSETQVSCKPKRGTARTVVAQAAIK